MKRTILLATLTLLANVTNAQTATDFLTPMKKADTDIQFDINAPGTEYRVNWGMDAAWDWDFNVNRGVAHIGKGNFATGRVSFQPSDLVIDNGDGTYTLTSGQQKKLKWRCDLMKLTGTTQVNINCDHEALFYKVDANGNYPEQNGAKITDYTGRTNYRGKPEEWYKLIKASVAYVRSQGLEVVSVSPFNEPDFVWEQATNETQAMKDFLAIAKLLKADPYFDDIRICGGNTLNDDRALPWYNYLKDYIDEGNTHQLAGSFDNYASFFTTVRNDGKVATADELHNVGEAIVGVNYGMQNGIWWGFDSKARGQFCIDSNEGVRIGYGENRGTWTCGAVYRNERTGEVHGYLGSSERQANAASYAFVSTTQDVYFNGYGPTRIYVYDVPGGTGYQKGQINAERLFDITWGEDVAPGVIDGTYQIYNASSKKLVTFKGSSNIQSASRVSSGTTQQWIVTPGYTDGDISYWFIDNNNTNPNTTATHLNVLNNNVNAGAGVICYNAGHGLNEQWYLKYAKDGYYYIISRLSNKYLYCPSSTSGTNLSLQEAPAETLTEAQLKRYLWRFQPIDAKADSKAPDAPTNLTAKQRLASVELSWTAPTDEDVVSYTILRGTVGDTETRWNTIGRNCTITTFVDNTTKAGERYQYKVFAVDYVGNRSETSEPLDAAQLDGKGLICQLQFDNNLNDQSANQMKAAIYGGSTFSSLFHKSGTHGLILGGSNYALLPYAIAQQDEMTISTWVYWTTASNWQRLFDFGNSTTQYMFFTPSTGSEMRFVMKNGGNEQILTPNKTLGTGKWHHVAITIKPVDDKVQVILYVDGENVAESNTFTIKPSDIAPSLCYLGRSMFANDPFFNGRVDDFRIYNYALSAEEVAGMMADLEVESKDLDDSYEEVTTSIDAPAADKAASGAWYNLQGQRVKASEKGILINNGKKFYQQ